MEALKLNPALRVEEVRDRDAFVRLQPEWDALVDATTPQPFLRHAFIRVWIDNFAPRATLRVLTVRDDDGALVGALPLMEERAKLYGVPVRQLVSAANAHSCRFDLIARDAEAVSAAMMAHLDADDSWDLLRIIDVPEGGDAWNLYWTAEAAGNPVGTWESLRSPTIPLPESIDALRKGLSSKFRANLRRRRRNLSEQGELTLERVEGGVHLAEQLEAGFELEAAGWKGERGTAIAQSADTRGFYTELARAMAYDGRLSLYFMKLDGRPIGFHYALTEGGRTYLLKPGYDPELNKHSPGQLLMEDVLEDVIGRGQQEFDFLGPDMVWKRDWTDRVRVHTWLYVFRRTRFGEGLCAAKFRWSRVAKEAREAVSRWKR